MLVVARGMMWAGETRSDGDLNIDNTGDLASLSLPVLDEYAHEKER